MPRCLECEKNKTIEETKNNATETAELMFKSFALEDKALIDSYTKPWNLQCSDLFLCKSLYLGRRWENGICREK